MCLYLWLQKKCCELVEKEAKEEKTVSLTEKNSGKCAESKSDILCTQTATKTKRTKIGFKPYQQELVFSRYTTSLNGKYQRNDGYKKCEKGEKKDRRKKRETTMSRKGCYAQPI